MTNSSDWGAERQHILKAVDRLEVSMQSIQSQQKEIITTLNKLQIKSELDGKNIDILSQSNKSLTEDLNKTKSKLQKLEDLKKKYELIIQGLGLLAGGLGASSLPQAIKELTNRLISG